MFINFKILLKFTNSKVLKFLVGTIDSMVGFKQFYKCEIIFILLKINVILIIKYRMIITNVNLRLISVLRLKVKIFI